MSGDVEIRRLEIGEAEAYRIIRLEALAGAPEAFSSRYEIEAVKPIESFAERLAASVVCVACLDGQIVGMAGLAPAPLDHARGAFVWGLYVRPEARGRGVARRLMDALLRVGADAFDEVRLVVFAEIIGAIRLYESLGFTRIGSSPRATPDGKGRRELIAMVWLPGANLEDRN
jgi:ribosomal protein S18 acetylase RimI-like enzyme